jgi:hypothetical protein
MFCSASNGAMRRKYTFMPPAECMPGVAMGQP